jgi:hypothetical protein
MRKMSKRIALLFVAGLVGLGCSDRSGLTFGGGNDSGPGVANGGQAVGGTGGIMGGSGGAVGSGGLLADGTGGSQAGSGGISGAGGCIPPPCALLDCPYGYLPSTSPCGCGQCAPDPSAGGGAQGSGAAASSGGALGLGGAGGSGGTGGCVPVACPMLACVSGYQPSPDPCGCPTCAPFDAGVAKDAGGAPSCAKVVCPSLPSACKKIVQDPNACCPTCTDTGCGLCPDLACPSGMHLETAVGACCPTCVPDPPDACMQGQQSYASMRASMLTKYSSSGCRNSSECVLVTENNLCAWNCNIPLPSVMSSSFVDNLSSAALSGCATCAAPAVPACERMIPACVNGTCVAANP